MGLFYHQSMVDSQFFTEEFKQAIPLAGAQARLDTLKAGVPVFYKDPKLKVDVIEHPDGRKFEIRFIDGAPRDRNYEVIRQVEGPSV